MAVDALANLDRATTMLAEAKSLTEVKHILDIAEAARVYARAARLGFEAYNHAAEIKVRAERKAGELLASMPKNPGELLRGNTVLPRVETPTLSDIGIQKMQSSRWQALAAIPQDLFEEAVSTERGENKLLTTSGILAVARLERRAVQIVADLKAAIDTRPVIECADAIEWLDRQDQSDLLLTDPPYMTDVTNIVEFAQSWLPLALSKVKPTGRAYVCIGAYPAELAAYMSVWMPTQVLVWTYRNTLGPSPASQYKQNWQAILYYAMPEAPPLDCPSMIEQFSVQDINAPDGRLGDRYHAWQKPLELAERFIRHATQLGDTVIDPFCCTGSFLLAAAKLGRVAKGCDNNPEVLDIAAERGCCYE